MLVPLAFVLTMIIVIVILVGRSRSKKESDQAMGDSSEQVDTFTIDEDMSSAEDVYMESAPRVDAGVSVFEVSDRFAPAPRVDAGVSVFEVSDRFAPAPRVDAGVSVFEVSDTFAPAPRVDAGVSVFDGSESVADQLAKLARAENVRLAEEFRVQQDAYMSERSQFQATQEQAADDLAGLSGSITSIRREQTELKQNVLNVQSIAELAILVEQKRVDTLLAALEGLDDEENERIRILDEFTDFVAENDLLVVEANTKLADATDKLDKYEDDKNGIEDKLASDIEEARKLDETYESAQTNLYGGVADDISGWDEIYKGADGTVNDIGLYFNPETNEWSVVDTQSEQDQAILDATQFAEQEGVALEGLRSTLDDAYQDSKDDEYGSEEELIIAKQIEDASTADSTTNAVLRIEEDGEFVAEQAVDQSSSELARDETVSADQSEQGGLVSASQATYAAENASISAGVGDIYSVSQDKSAKYRDGEFAKMGDQRVREICGVTSSDTWGEVSYPLGKMAFDAEGGSCMDDLNEKMAANANALRPMKGCIPQSVYDNLESSNNAYLADQQLDSDEKDFYTSNELRAESDKWNDCFKFYTNVDVGLTPGASAPDFEITCASSENDPIPPVNCYGEWDKSDCKNPTFTIFETEFDKKKMGEKTWNVMFDPMFGGTCPHPDGHVEYCVTGDAPSEARDEFEMGLDMAESLFA